MVLSRCREKKAKKLINIRPVVFRPAVDLTIDVQVAAKEPMQANILEPASRPDHGELGAASRRAAD